MPTPRAQRWDAPRASTKTILGIAVLAALLSGCARMPATENGSGTATGRFQFGYVVTSPSRIAAQVFSGEDHTYLSLPPDVQLQVATGNGTMVPSARHGPYWVVDGLATEWRFATSQGMVDATATGAAKEMAQVDQAQQAVQRTLPAASPKPAPAALPTAHHQVAPGHPSETLPKSGALKTGTNTNWKDNPHFHVGTVRKNTSGLHAGHPVRMIPGSGGRYLPLVRAVHHIEPIGWNVYLGKYVNPSMPVLWHKGPWVQSLKRMARDNDLVPGIQWRQKTVHLSASPAMLSGIAPSSESRVPPLPSPAPAPEKKTKQPAPQQSTHALVFHHASILTIVHPATTPIVPVTVQPFIPAPLVSPAQPIIFHAVKGQMLSHDLRIYLKKKGWHLAWNLSQDWPIAYSFTLTGNLHATIRQIAHLYPIRVTGDGLNHTVDITATSPY